MTSSDDAARIAAEMFGIVATATALPGEHDLNFRLDAADARYILKLHAAGSDPVVLDLQDTALRAAGVPILIAGATPVGDRLGRVLAWIDGTAWAHAADRTPDLIRDLGAYVARVDRSLAQVEHPAIDRPHRWNMLQALDLVDALPLVAAELRPFATDTLARFEALRAELDALPRQLIHNDANEHNVIVGDDGRIAGLIDFGDVVRAPRICGLAVACAYAMLGQSDPGRAVVPLVAGYHAVAPLRPAELALLDDLIRTRLAISICNAAVQRREQPTNAYLAISQEPIADLVARLATADRELAHARFRNACGYRPVPTERAIVAFLASDRAVPAPVIRLEEGRPGGYRERRDWYRGEAFATGDPAERRTVHVAVDVWHSAGEPVHAPFDGVVEAFADRAERYDFGPVVILRHATDRGVPFYTLYGHLARTAVEGLVVGHRVRAGDRIGTLGEQSENGGWEPHLHFQLLTTLVGMETAIHGVAALSELDVWESICPDPELVLRAGLTAAPRERDAGEIAARRRVNLSAALSISYRDPLEIVRGEGAYLFDRAGGRWLDLVNNVCHVGHCHPHVVAALTAQAPVLNTNTRYLHPLIVEYARRLLALFPDPLSVVFLTNSGSEANDLALRLARTHTGRRDVLVLDHAYHGNLSSLIDLSPYKFNRAGGRGCPSHVRVCEIADPYRGRFGADGAAYADDVRAACGERVAAALFVESFPGCAGQIELAPGYLEAAFAHARAAGVVCVCDEVQVGFGRVGTHLWGFETQAVVPDIVTLGKPIGNGHPLGAVVTTAQIARSFSNGMEYFNTFGGNPVSAAVGLAVLDVIRAERLQARADRLGTRMLAALRELQERHELIGDVRGRGLYIGVELVRDRATKEPATTEASAVKEAVKSHGVLLSTDGPFDNVLKIKPPLVLNASDVDRAVAAIDRALTEVRLTASV